jgi:hypothetical protein
MGGQSPVERKGDALGIGIDSFNGPVRVEWAREAALTPLGQLPFFIDFLKTAALFEALVADCPRHYTSPNAPETRDILGTAMLSILSGHKRHAQIAALRGDGVLPEPALSSASTGPSSTISVATTRCASPSTGSKPWSCSSPFSASRC